MSPKHYATMFIINFPVVDTVWYFSLFLYSLQSSKIDCLLSQLLLLLKEAVFLCSDQYDGSRRLFKVYRKAFPLSRKGRGQCGWHILFPSSSYLECGHNVQCCSSHFATTRARLRQSQRRHNTTEQLSLHSVISLIYYQAKKKKVLIFKSLLLVAEAFLIYILSTVFK